MRKIYLILCLIVSLTFSVSAQQMLVSGSDYPGVNGTYTLTSSGTNFSKYEKDEDPSYYFEGNDLGGGWNWEFYITNWDQYSRFYSGFSSGSDPTAVSWYGGFDFYTETSYSTPVISLILTTASVTTATAGSITYFGATLGGEVTNEGASSVTSYGIQWGLSAVDLSNTTVIGSGGGYFDQTFSGLTPNTTYYFRAFAINSNGTVYGDVLNFQTLLATPSVSTAAAGSISYFGATLGGEVTNIGGSSVTSRGIKWGLSADNLNNTILISSGVGSFDESITGLSPGTIYYYRAFATNSYGTAYSDVLNFTTLHNGFDVLVVSGGGSGGAGYGGGGGGGAVKYFIAPPVSGTTAVTVGAGGAAVQITTFRIPVVGNPGESSSFGSLVATSSSSANGANDSGGGGGGGGSGGGAGGSFGKASGGTAVSGMGYDGGGAQGNGRNFSNVCGGGGGGAGAIGADGLYGTGGTGGVGISNSISGAAVYYGGGGGGGITYNGDFAGSGGNGGGGAGSKDDVTATSGTANTGGGGGGFGGVNGGESVNFSGAGGSGIVIIRYLGSTTRATGGTITQVGGYTIHTFYSSGTFSLLCGNLNSGGTIADAQSGTNPFNPAAFTSSSAASGQSGTLEYKWQSSTINSSSGFSDIVSSNAATYEAGALTQTTWFKRLARVTCSADWSGAVESNVLEVTVIQSLPPTASAQTFCESKTVADLIATGTNLQWYSAEIGGTALISSTVLTTGTYYVSQTVSGSESTRTAVPVTVIILSQSVAPSIGDGTLAAPYQIATFENLLWISENSTVWGLNFIQTADIDASITTDPCFNSGLGWSPIGTFPQNANFSYTDLSFYGVYNGQGHTISNLMINRPTEERIGLFGRVGKNLAGLVTDVHLINVNINANDVAGAVVGQLYTKVEKSSATGTISSAYDWAFSLGGIVGQMEGGSEISLSSANVSVIGTGIGANKFGGFCGTNGGGTISNSYAVGSVTAKSGAGGFVGDNTRGTIMNCYSTGSTVATTNGGGFVGVNTMEDYGAWSDEPTFISGTINNCFWDSEASGLSSSDGGISKSTLEMKTATTFTNIDWDFSTIWSINPLKNSGYPDFIRTDVSVIFFWTGANNNTWSDAGNWSTNSVPIASSDVIIAAATNQPLLASDVAINSLTIDSGATVVVPTGINLKVANSITNSGTMTVQNNANLIQVADVANIGSITVERNSAPVVRLDHTLWSSPVKDQNLFSFSPATLTNRFYTYNTSTNAYVNTGLDATSTFIAGKGFAIRAPNNQTAVTPTAWQGTFTGVPNNGTIPFVLNASASGYNLVGNPYPSTLDADAFIAENLDLAGTLYFYAHSLSMDANGVFPSGTNYATWNSLGSTAATYIVGDVHLVPVPPTGIIQVGQGFFVKANAPGTFNFTNAMRVANNDNQYFRTKAIEKDRLWLNLKTETGTDINQILVGYITGATQEVDRNYDGLSFGNAGSYLSSKIATDDYAIQGRSQPFDSSDIVPLGFKAATAGNYSIVLSKSDGLFAGNQEVFLQDNLAGITHNIKESVYSFSSQAGTFDARFSLVYAKTLGVDTNSLNPNSVQVYKDGEWFRVNTNGITMQEVSVYDLAGRLIFKQSGINDTTTLLKGLSQVNEAMLVKIVSQENQTVTVKVIN